MTPDNPLYFLMLIPARYRLWFYVVIAMAALVLAGWQASKGDFSTFAAFIIMSLGHGLAAIRVTPDAPTQETTTNGNAQNM